MDQPDLARCPVCAHPGVESLGSHGGNPAFRCLGCGDFKLSPSVARYASRDDQWGETPGAVKRARAMASAHIREMSTARDSAGESPPLITSEEWQTLKSLEEPSHEEKKLRVLREIYQIARYHGISRLEFFPTDHQSLMASTWCASPDEVADLVCDLRDDKLIRAEGNGPMLTGISGSPKAAVGLAG
jgi:hypothetical protein